jgi:uncharacterized membrane protein YhhN
VFLLSEKVVHFQIGLVVFLLGNRKLNCGGIYFVGHISYIVAFYNLCAEYDLVLIYPNSYLFPLFAVIFSSLIFAYLWYDSIEFPLSNMLLTTRPSLGKMKVEVFAYVLVISTMVILAYFASLIPALQTKGKILIFMGTILFYLSDIFVAFEKYVKFRL